MQALKKLGESFKRFFNSTEYFRFVLFAALFFGLERVSVLSVMAILVWSIYLFVKKMLIEKRIRRVRYRKVLYLFLGGAILTVLIHSDKNLIENLFIIYVMTVYFFQLYGIYAEKSNIRCRKELKHILTFIVIATTSLMVLGLIGLAIFPKGFSWNRLHFILHESRFVGLLFNANVAGFYSAMAVIACHLLWRVIRAEKKLSVRRKICYILCIVINAITLFLSDSNAALLFLVVYCSFVMFYIMFRDFGKKRKHGFLLRIAATALSCIVIVTSLMFFRVLTQSRVSLAITSGHSETELSKGTISENGKVILTDDEYRENLFGHENTNIDSGRFKIWKQSFQMIEKFPLLGVGKANIVDYGAEYIGGLKYNDFHNGLITIIVSYGLVGFNLFMVFAITIGRDLLKTIFQYKKKCRDDGSVLVLITAFCTAYFVYSMFEQALLVDCSYRIYIFWLLVGLGMSYVLKYRCQAKRDNENTDQSVTDLPSAVENIRQKRRLKHQHD